MRDLYFLTSIIMTDPQTSDMRQIRQMMLALLLSSARLSKAVNSMSEQSFRWRLM